MFPSLSINGFAAASILPENRFADWQKEWDGRNNGGKAPSKKACRDEYHGQGAREPDERCPIAVAMEWAADESILA